ncbi:MAG: hypothetical protein CMP20_01720 [Rickettsiales bacterium]|nr:hypothetical protein [Rickettsiales bacterium]
MLCVAGDDGTAQIFACRYSFNRIVFIVGWVFFALMFVTFTALLVVYANDDQWSRMIALFTGFLFCGAAVYYGWNRFTRNIGAPVTPIP